LGETLLRRFAPAGRAGDHRLWGVGYAPHHLHASHDDASDREDGHAQQANAKALCEPDRAFVHGARDRRCHQRRDAGRDAFRRALQPRGQARKEVLRRPRGEKLGPAIDLLQQGALRFQRQVLRRGVVFVIVVFVNIFAVNISYMNIFAVNVVFVNIVFVNIFAVVVVGVASNADTAAAAAAGFRHPQKRITHAHARTHTHTQNNFTGGTFARAATRGFALKKINENCNSGC
jgi:hypothetical protein